VKKDIANGRAVSDMGNLTSRSSDKISFVKSKYLKYPITKRFVVMPRMRKPSFGLLDRTCDNKKLNKIDAINKNTNDGFQKP